MSVCLTSVVYVGLKSRTEMPRKTKIGTQVAHVTRDSDTTFRVKGQGHQSALLTAVYGWLQQSAWECTAVFRSARRREALRRPLREERDGGILCRHTHSLLNKQLNNYMYMAMQSHVLKTFNVKNVDVFQ